MRICFLGDLHLYSLSVRPWQLLSKRLLGQLNLWLNRRSRFDLTEAPAVMHRIESLRPDLLLCSGDLTTTALPQEFELARRIVAPTFERQTTFLVAGNHDRYTFTATRQRYLECYFARHTTQHWPHHRPLGEDLRLVGLDAARPTLLFAGSRLSDKQLWWLEDLLRGINRSQRLILLGHYPPGTPPGYPPEPWTHRLRNAERLVRLLADVGHETLLLHGHVHQPWCWRLREAPNVVAVNAGAPLMHSAGYPHGQGFWRIETGEAEAAWHLRHEVMDAEGTWRSAEAPVPAEPGGVAPLDSPSSA